VESGGPNLKNVEITIHCLKISEKIKISKIYVKKLDRILRLLVKNFFKTYSFTSVKFKFHQIYLNSFKRVCNRTTSEKRGLSPKIILGDSRRSENAQTHINKHTIPNMKFKLKLLQIKCHGLGFTKDKVQNVL
jgi:hypothetical protein